MLTKAKYETIRAFAQKNIDKLRAEAADRLAMAKDEPLATGRVQRAIEAQARADGYEEAVRLLLDGIGNLGDRGMNGTMNHFDIETTIAGRFVCLVGTSDGDGNWTVERAYDLDLAAQNLMTDAERDALVAEHRKAIDSALWDHWCSEREKHDERTWDRRGR